MNKYLAVLVAALPPAMKPHVLRLLGVKVGRNVRIGFGTLLLCREMDLGDDVSIGNFSTIRADRLRMGPRSRIGSSAKFNVHTLTMKSQSAIDGQTIINGDSTDPRSSVYMGPASWVFPFCFLDANRSIRLGKNVGVGGSSYLFTHGRWLSKLDGFPVSFGDIVIGDDVWIPWRCFIMPGVNIGSRTIIAACSVVTKDVPDGALAAGAPARIGRWESW
jgi:acetyltransferase-like isoleucine patch superfamily enzyme